MLKKKIAILPLFVTCMFMLVFAIFPHHHHHEFICFNKVHCEQAESESHKSHQHFPCSEEDECIAGLFQAEVQKSLSLNHSDICADGHCHHFTIASYLMSELSDLLQIEQQKHSFPDVRDEILCSAVFAADKAGRAPPLFS